MSTKVTDYLTEKIEWRETGDPTHPYAAEIDGEKYLIRLNDFPDEHLYTLLVDGNDVADFDDWSACWKRPTQRQAD